MEHPPGAGKGCQTWALALQIALVIPTASDTSELTMITIVLAAPPGRRRPWVLASIPAVALGIVFEFWRYWNLIRPELADPLGAAILHFTQVLGFAGWSVLAFYALSLLVQSESIAQAGSVGCARRQSAAGGAERGDPGVIFI